MQYTDLHLWMVGDILLKADKMSMANSLELRVPFWTKRCLRRRGIPVESGPAPETQSWPCGARPARWIPEKTADKKNWASGAGAGLAAEGKSYAAIVRQGHSPARRRRSSSTQGAWKAAGPARERQAGQLAPDLVRIHVPYLVRRVL